MTAAPPAFDEGNTVFLLKQAFTQGLRAIDHEIARHGVTTAQLGMLQRLTEEPGLSGAELARRLLITPQGAQLGLAALEKRGLVQRRPHPDHGRILRAFVTAKGRRITAAAQVDGTKGVQQFVDVLDREQQEALRHLLEQLVADRRGTDQRTRSR